MSAPAATDRGPRRTAGLAAGLFALLGIVLVAALLAGAWPMLGAPRSVANILGAVWDPLRGRFGVAPFVAGTAAVTLTALVMAIPVALGAAVTVVHQMGALLREWTMRALAVLTAVPSVVFGWWGLQMVVPWVRSHVGGPGFSLLTAGIVLALMILPTLSLFFAQALTKVPNTLQEGSAALGATPDQTLIRLEFPYAMPALVNGVTVGLARALGETMAVQMVIGGQTALPGGLAAPGATLTTQIFTDITAFPPGTAGHSVLDFMALLLIAAMYGLVRVAERWGAR